MWLGQVMPALLCPRAGVCRYVSCGWVLEYLCLAAAGLLWLTILAPPALLQPLQDCWLRAQGFLGLDNGLTGGLAGDVGSREASQELLLHPYP